MLPLHIVTMDKIWIIILADANLGNNINKMQILKILANLGKKKKELVIKKTGLCVQKIEKLVVEFTVTNKNANLYKSSWIMKGFS